MGRGRGRGGGGGSNIGKLRASLSGTFLQKTYVAWSLRYRVCSVLVFFNFI